MGLGYGYFFYYRRSQLWDVMDYLIEIGRPDTGFSTTLIAGEETREYPIFIFNHTTWDLGNPEHEDISYCLSLPFAVDAVVQEYLDTGSHRDLNAQGQMHIGCIYMNIVLDQQAIERTGFDVDVIAFEFRAASNSMSRLFEKSAATYQGWLKIAKETNALYGVFHRGGQGKEIICWLDGKEYAAEIDDEWTPADEAREIIRGLNPSAVFVKPCSCPLNAVKTHKRSHNSSRTRASR